MKVAILHPWFLMRGGGEKVVDVLAGMYPEADVYALFSNPEMLSPILQSRGVRASLLNDFPFASRLHRQLREGRILPSPPCYPRARHTR